MPAERGMRTRAYGRARARPWRSGTCTTWSTPSPHAVSVHAYSPPLTAMSYYAVDAAGDLRRTRTVLTDGRRSMTTVDDLLAAARSAAGPGRPA